jgi:hypothetical protein
MSGSAGCADPAHLAKAGHNPLKKHNRTEAHIAPLYPALLIGRFLAELSNIVVCPLFYDKTL